MSEMIMRAAPEAVRQAFQFTLDTWGAKWVEQERDALIEFAWRLLGTESVSDEQPKAEDPKGLSLEGASAVPEGQTSNSSLPVWEK